MREDTVFIFWFLEPSGVLDFYQRFSENGKKCNGGSSNGRTTVSESVYRGSSPCPPAIFRPAFPLP